MQKSACGNELQIGSGDFSAVCGEVLRSARALTFRVHGVSMSPFLKDGDILTLQQVVLPELSAGDIVLYRSSEKLAHIHRILRISRHENRVIFSIRGDASCGPCELVAAEQVVAKVVEVRRGNGVLCPGNWQLRALALTWARVPKPLRRLAAYLIRGS